MSKYSHPNSLMHKFLKAQLKNPNKNDRGQTVLGDLEYLEMDVTISDIAGTPMEIFKSKVKEKIQQAALEYFEQGEKWS